MRRQVVKELPEKAVLIRPTKEKPVITKNELKNITDEQDHSTQRVIPVTYPWPLDPDTARLIGEAKPLPKGSSLRLDEAYYIAKNSTQVAWFCTNKKLNLLHFRDSYYISKQEALNGK